MKSRIASLFGALLCACLPFGAASADFPSKPVTIVVPYPAGGSTDALSRIVAQKMQSRLGQPVIVDNKPGASEQIAATYTMRQPADGHTIMLMTMTGMAVNPGLYRKLPYDPQKDFVPIVQAVTIPSVFVVHPEMPVKNMAELTAYLKARPGTESYASSGNGTPSHLGMELYKRAAGVDIVNVPYKGGAPALQDVMAGQVKMMMALAPEAMPMVKAGKLRALALTANQRSPLYPDLPTLVEAGFGGSELIFWYAYVAPKGTPSAVAARLSAAICDSLHEPDAAAKLAELGLNVSCANAKKLDEIVKSDTLKWKKVIDDAGIKLD
jgi:tripartite-type tricarboxylate transporter receptor subunit TctC